MSRAHDEYDRAGVLAAAALSAVKTEDHPTTWAVRALITAAQRLMIDQHAKVLMTGEDDDLAGEIQKFTMSLSDLRKNLPSCT